MPESKTVKGSTPMVAWLCSGDNCTTVVLPYRGRRLAECPSCRGETFTPVFVYKPSAEDLPESERPKPKKKKAT